jgi:hypothetical protein
MLHPFAPFSPAGIERLWGNYCLYDNPQAFPVADQNEVNALLVQPVDEEKRVPRIGTSATKGEWR